MKRRNKMTPTTNGTFVKIGNREIYDKILSIEKKIDDFTEKNGEDHAMLKGKAKLNFYIATSAMSIIIIIIVFLLNA